MKDILEFESDSSYMIRVEDNTAVVSLPLSVFEFRQVYNSANTKEDGLLHLAYVANYCHHGSSFNLRGLSDEEKHKEIINSLGLPKDFEQTDEIKFAISYYDKHYNQSIFGLFKELRKSYELTRKSISIINTSISSTIDALTNGVNGHTIDDIKTTKTLISDLLSDLGTVKQLTTNLNEDIKRIKELESDLALIEINDVNFRGESLPKSAR